VSRTGEQSNELSGRYQQFEENDGNQLVNGSGGGGEGSSVFQGERGSHSVFLEKKKEGRRVSSNGGQK